MQMFFFYMPSLWQAFDSVGMKGIMELYFQQEVVVFWAVFV